MDQPTIASLTSEDAFEQTWLCLPLCFAEFQTKRLPPILRIETSLLEDETLFIGEERLLRARRCDAKDGLSHASALRRLVRRIHKGSSCLMFGLATAYSSAAMRRARRRASRARRAGLFFFIGFRLFCCLSSVALQWNIAQFPRRASARFALILATLSVGGMSSRGTCEFARLALVLSWMMWPRWKLANEAPVC